MPMSLTPKKMEFMIMKHSAAEFVNARRVALMVSAENLKSLIYRLITYNTLGLDNIDCRVNEVLGCQ